MCANKNQGVEVISKAFVNMWRENKEIKERVEELEFENLSLKVFNRIDGWLNTPYEEKSEREDVEKFAREITRFIVHEVKS